MKKKSYILPVALVIAAVGAYRLVQLWTHPHLPPVARAEVIWGDLSDTPPSGLQAPQIDPSLCTAAGELASEEQQAPATAATRIRFEYRPVASEFVNQGDSLQVLMEPGSSLTLGEETYPLRQLVLHSDGSGQLGLTLVHRTKKGRTAVVSVPLQTSTTPNPTLDPLLRYLPMHRGERNALDEIHIDINNLLPRDRSFYRYPAQAACSDKVVVLGLNAPVRISAAQSAKISQALEH